MSEQNTLADLFARNPLEIPHTDEELDRIIAYFREARAKHMLGKSAKAPPVGKINIGELDV